MTNDEAFSIAHHHIVRPPRDDVRAALVRLSDLARDRPTPKVPQDMTLRELFDHVAIVNDAIRAALLTHPGMTPR